MSNKTDLPDIREHPVPGYIVSHRTTDARQLDLLRDLRVSGPAKDQDGSEPTGRGHDER